MHAAAPTCVRQQLGASRGGHEQPVVRQARGRERLGEVGEVSPLEGRDALEAKPGGQGDQGSGRQAGGQRRGRGHRGRKSNQ